MRADQILNPISLRWPFSPPHLPTSTFPTLTPRSKKGKNNLYAIPDIFILNTKGNRVLSTYHRHENISFFPKCLVSTRGEKNVRERLTANVQNGTGVRLRRSFNWFHLRIGEPILCCRFPERGAALRSDSAPASTHHDTPSQRLLTENVSRFPDTPQQFQG